MTRFSNAAEVVAWADSAAASDSDFAKRGASPNPYSTAGRRNDWQRGYNNLGPRSYESWEVLTYDPAYQRGSAYRRRVDAGLSDPVT